MMPKLNIRPGDRYGMLTIVKELESYKRPSGGTIRRFRCKCNCGNETEVLFSSLRSGLTVSCGCYLRKRSREQMTRHGMKGTRIYNIYRGIKQRCLNPKNQHYPLYGGRGIRMCNEWANSPEAFFKWAFANGYTENLTLDRIDVNGDYEPSNCRWATHKQQMNNTRSNFNIEYGGVVKTLHNGLNPLESRLLHFAQGYCVDGIFRGR